jgi:hypothetical protein
MSLKEQFERRLAGLPPPCLETGPKPLTLSIYLAGGETWVLPWSRFSHARLSGETLTATFADQEIVIHGQNLCQVAKAISNLGVEILRTMAPQYRPLVPNTEAFISAIEIRAGGQLDVTAPKNHRHHSFAKLNPPRVDRLQQRAPIFAQRFRSATAQQGRWL